MNKLPIIRNNLTNTSFFFILRYKVSICVSISSCNGHNKHFDTNQTIFNRINNFIWIETFNIMIEIQKYFISKSMQYNFLPKCKK